ncbi:hypothetical protein MCY_00908 [Bartonella rattimassiliensis 15908]|uniref:Uncharacterized protein n=1 Tax=Bartonella rattimassiliensis 15908 TaxID=1094556 RepID=J0QKE2_9HYPH|nr:hypothetical protein MCY_00908 [Bartonella rattimassiliensis 15908]
MMCSFKLENKTPLNDNGSLNDKTCLEVIPYKQALQQNGWGGNKAYHGGSFTRRAF